LINPAPLGRDIRLPASRVTDEHASATDGKLTLQDAGGNLIAQSLRFEAPWLQNLCSHFLLTITLRCVYRRRHHFRERAAMKSLVQIFGIAMAAVFAGCTAARQPDSSQPAPAEPKRVTGIGGIFFKCNDPKATREWYAAHLGLQIDEYGTNFEWRQADEGTRKGFTQWSPFPENTTYYEPSKKDFMTRAFPFHL
jgi:hypothetical protein